MWLPTGNAKTITVGVPTSNKDALQLPTGNSTPVAENDRCPAQVGLTRNTCSIQPIMYGRPALLWQFGRATGSSSLFRARGGKRRGACQASIFGPCASGPP
jgi:hypothetical protein